VKLYFHFQANKEVIVSLLSFISYSLFCNTPLIPWALGASLNSRHLATQSSTTSTHSARWRLVFLFTGEGTLEGGGEIDANICKPIWTGKIKKPCIYKQITGLLRHSWTGEKTIRCFGFALASAQSTPSAPPRFAWYPSQSISTTACSLRG
jgi:hypothetical protein